MRFIRYLAVACLPLFIAASAGARPATDSNLVTDALLRSADQDQPTADTQLPPAMSKADSNSEIQGKHEPKGPKDPKDPKDPPPTDPGTPSPNPEPGTFLLLGTAAAAALKLRRRS